MSVDSRLHIWPKMDKADPRIATVKEAVLGLALPYPVRPFYYEPGLSEGVERVLVLADGFEYGTVVDYIYPKSPKVMAEAVRWALEEGESKGAREAMDILRKIFGEELAVYEEKYPREEEEDGPDYG